MLSNPTPDSSVWISQAEPPASQINQDIENRYGDLLNQADQQNGQLQRTPLLEQQQLLEKLDPELAKQLQQQRQERQQALPQTKPQTQVSGLLDPFLQLPLPVQVGAATVTGLGVLTFGILATRSVQRHFRQTDYLHQFDLGPGQKIQAYLSKTPQQLAWWDQPRWRGKSWGQHLCSTVYKPPVPQGMEFMHRREFAKLTQLARQAGRIDNDKFSGKEFLAYLYVRAELTNSQITGLYYSAQRLKSALAAKRNFDQIWQIESQYFGRKQQEFYRFVDHLLQEQVEGNLFVRQVQAKLAALLPNVVHEQGRTVLQTYANHLIDLSQFEYGLELLGLFKRYDLTGYVVLRQIDDLLNTLKNLDLTNSDVVKPDIMANFEAFEQLAPIIKMPKKLIHPDGFASLVHFVVLEVKHQVAYHQFKELRLILERWIEPYQQIKELRDACLAQQYRLPQEFQADIPGLTVFKKYQSVLEVQAEFNPAS
jgi:hypothetical protein